LKVVLCDWLKRPIKSQSVKAVVEVEIRRRNDRQNTYILGFTALIVRRTGLMDDIKGRGNLRGAIAFHNSRLMLSMDRQLETPVTGPSGPKSEKKAKYRYQRERILRIGCCNTSTERNVLCAR
jgi:hypothetical protein